MKKYILILFLISWTYGCSQGQVLSTEKDSLQVSAMAIDSTYRIKVESFIAPVVLIGYGAVSLAGNNFVRKLDYSTNNELREDHPSFSFKLDDHLRYVPIFAVYSLDLLGIKARNNLADRTIMLISSYALVSVTTSAVKGLSNRLRPDESNYHSFPSAHTSLAFMAAEFLHQEYKYHSIWYSIGGYAIATGTGILRLYNNAHWVSDVVAGAGFGILSTKLVYLVYPYIKRKLFHGRSAGVVISPGYQNGYLTFNFVKRF